MTKVYSESIVDRVMSRGAPPADTPLTRGWDRLLVVLSTVRDKDGDALAEVLGNLVMLAAYGDRQDYVDLLALAEIHGEEELPGLQHQAFQLLEHELGVDLATAVAVGLKTVAFDAAGDLEEHVATRCGEAGVRLLLHDIGKVSEPRWVTSAAELVEAVDCSTFDAWRALAAAIIESPWSPYATRVAEMAVEAGRPDIQAALEVLIEIGRELVRAREREQVAAEVRRLVGLSGLTQEKFAHRVGTSPSRFSTYVSGRVVPSAAMLMRMAREVSVIQRERAARQEESTGVADSLRPVRK